MYDLFLGFKKYPNDPTNNAIIKSPKNDLIYIGVVTVTNLIEKLINKDIIK